MGLYIEKRVVRRESELGAFYIKIYTKLKTMPSRSNFSLYVIVKAPMGGVASFAVRLQRLIQVITSCLSRDDQLRGI